MSNINVASINMSLMSEREMIEKSKGQVTSSKIPMIKQNSGLSKPYLEIDENSVFSERIFGVSKDSLRGIREMTDKINEERKQNFGHIKLPIPYINPVVYSKPVNKISILLGTTETTVISDIIEYERFLVKVPSPSSLDTDLLKLSKTSTSTGVKKITFLSFVDVKNYNYYAIRTNSFGKNSKLPEDIKTTFGLKKNTDALIGAYAIIMMFQGLDTKTELARTRKALQDFSISVDRVRSKGDSIANLLNRRYNILLNMIKNGLDFSDLTHFTVLVTPASYRDAQIVVDITRDTKIQLPEINKFYNTLITNSKKLVDSNYPIPETTDELYHINYKKWINDIPIQYSSFINAAKQIQDDVTSLIREGIGKLIGKKEGIAREEVLSKRSDYTLRGVIVPDPKLELDQMGIPLKLIYPIVRIPFKKWLGEADKELYNELNNMLSKDDMFIDSVESMNDISFKAAKNSPLGDIAYEKREAAMESLQEYLDTIRIILIRFPSLHMYSKLGFKIKLIDGYTMKLHPLVCKPFNADFDGDTMSGYVQFTEKSREEIDKRLLPSRKILGPSGGPIISLSQDAVLGSYFMTMEKSKDRSNPVEYFDNYYDMLAMYEGGLLNIHDVVSIRTPRYDKSIFEYEYKRYRDLKELKVKDYREIGISPNRNQLKLPKTVLLNKYEQDDFEWVTSTVGRFIFNSAIPQDLGYVDRTKNPYELEIDSILNGGIGDKQIKNIVQRVVFNKDLEKTKFVLDRMKENGYSNATLSGTSLTLQDLVPPKRKHEVVTATEAKVAQMKREGAKPEEISLEWKKASSKLSDEAMDELEPDNPLKMMVISGARGNKGQISQMISMRSIMADATGNEIPTPVEASFVEGMTLPEMFIGSYATRKGIYDKGTKTRVTGEATRIMVFGMEDVVLYNGDCGDTVGTLIKATDTKKLSSSVCGKITLEDLVDEDGNIFAKKGHIISVLDKDKVDKLYCEKGIRVRSPLSCKGKDGICCKCYGYSYDKIRFSRIGDPVGIIAAQTLGEPGTQLTLQTFHTGGQAKSKKTAGFDTIKKWITTSLYESTVNEAYKLYTEPKLPKEKLDNMKQSEISLQKSMNIKRMVARTKESVKTNLVKYLDDPSTPIGFESFGVLGGNDVYPGLMKNLANTLDSLYSDEGVSITSVHFELFARAMLGRYKVIDSGDTELIPDDIIDWKTLYGYNTRMAKEGKDPLVVIPQFYSTDKLGLDDSHIMTALMFKNINSAVSRASLIKPIDKLINPMSSTAVANPVPVGENTVEFMDIIREDSDNYKDKDELMKEIGVEWAVPEQPIEETTQTIEETTQPTEETIPEVDWEKTVDEISEDVEEKFDEEEENKKEEEQTNADMSWDQLVQSSLEKEEEKHEDDNNAPKDLEDSSLDMGWDK